MADHIHTWEPVPGHLDTVRCDDCGDTGYREHGGRGAIRAHRKPKAFAPPTSAESILGGDGAVSRAPSLDELERGWR